jgi:hypothetical protein
VRVPVRRTCGLRKALALFVLGCLAVVAVLGLAESSLAELAQLTITGPDGATIDGAKVPTAAVTFTFATTNFQASSFTCLLTRADSPLSPIPADPPDCSTIESPSTGGSVTYENLSNGPYVFKVDAYSTEPKTLTEQRTFTVNVVSGGTDGGRTPTVAIKKHPATSTQARTATFTFVAVPPDAHLRCWLDSRQPTDCVGEQSYGKTHQLRLAATHSISRPWAAEEIVGRGKSSQPRRSTAPILDSRFSRRRVV